MLISVIGSFIQAYLLFKYSRNLTHYLPLTSAVTQLSNFPGIERQYSLFQEHGTRGLDTCFIVSWMIYQSGYLELRILLCQPWTSGSKLTAAAAAKSRHSCPTLCDPLDGSPPGSPRPWDSPGKNTGVACHFLLQCMKVNQSDRGTRNFFNECFS